MRFCAEPDPPGESCALLAALAPENPFHTYAYVEAMESLGYQPWLLSQCEEGRVLSACMAFMKSGRLNRSLEITSLPCLPDSHLFWEGLLRFSHEVGISHLVVDSFAAASASIPSMPGEVSRRARTEYLLELKSAELGSAISSNHRRNIKRAQRAGLSLRRTVTTKACEEHARLLDASMERRQGRGEVVSAGAPVRSFLALIGSGAGELYQAVLQDAVLSSVFVLRAKRGAYFYSAGTSPDGMALGASHFLVHELIGVLKEESLDLFNLGGAEESNPGLVRFKSGFGSRRVSLEAAVFFLGGSLRWMLGKSAQFLRDLAPVDRFRRKAGPKIYSGGLAKHDSTGFVIGGGAAHCRCDRPVAS